MLSHTWTRIALSYAALVLVMGGLLAFLLSDEAHAVAYNSAPLFASSAPISPTNTLAHEMSGLFGTRVTLIRPDGVVVGDSEEDPLTMENHAARPEVAQVLANPKSIGTASRLSATVHRQLLYVASAVTDPSDPS